MQPFTALVSLAIVLALTAPLTEATTGRSVAQLLKALIQDEESAKMLHEAMVQNIDASEQGFSLNIVGCGSITSTVYRRLCDYLKELFPGKRVTISCTGAGMSYQHKNVSETWLQGG